MKILNSTQYFSKNLLLVCDDERLASILLISLINFSQAKHEDTININMAAQVVLAKFPKTVGNFLPSLQGGTTKNEHELFYKSVFELVTTSYTGAFFLFTLFIS